MSLLQPCTDALPVTQAGKARQQAWHMYKRLRSVYSNIYLEGFGYCKLALCYHCVLEWKKKWIWILSRCQHSHRLALPWGALQVALVISEGTNLPSTPDSVSDAGSVMGGRLTLLLLLGDAAAHLNQQTVCPAGCKLDLFPFYFSSWSWREGSLCSTLLCIQVCLKMHSWVERTKSTIHQSFLLVYI